MNNNPPLLTLILLTGFASFAALLYTPALPDIMRQLNISENAAHMTMTVFLMGYMIGQLMYGPITNRFGRKPTIYVGIGIGIVGALICVLSSLFLSYPALLIGLFITALGTSVGLVIAFAMINDTYEGTRARKIISYATLAFAVLPGIAAFIGGLLVKYVSWASCFYFLIAYSLFILALSVRLPETSKGNDPNALKITHVCQRYITLLKNKTLTGYAVIWGLSTTIVYLFAAISPNIAINTLHASPALFGVLNLVTSAGLILGNLTSARLADKLSGQNAILLGIIFAVVGSLLLAIIFLMHALTLFRFYFPVGIIFFGLSLVFTNASALAARSSDDKATASSMITLLNMGTAVTGLTISNIFFKNVDDAMPFIFLGIVVVMMLLSIKNRF